MAKGKSKPAEVKAAPADEDGFRAFIEANPNDGTARAAYADWLDEHDRPIEAAEQRDAAGISEVQYKLRRKSDGLFIEGRERDFGWSPKGKVWRSLHALHMHLAAARGERAYHGTDLGELEVVVLEVRPVTLAILPLTFKKRSSTCDVKAVVIGEPVHAGST
jgi:uncharacterized protein (TIGR02996 family)